MRRRPGGAGRPTLVRRTHEPNQASRRGFNRSDASWGTLLAVREETRGRSRQRRESSVRCFGGSEDGWECAGKRRRRAERGARIALVGQPPIAVVVLLAVVALLRIDMLVRHVGGSRHGLVHRVVRRVLQAQFGLTARACNGAEHRRSDCTPDGKQYREQQQQQDAGRSHGVRLARGRPACSPSRRWPKKLRRPSGRHYTS